MKPFKYTIFGPNGSILADSTVHKITDVGKVMWIAIKAIVAGQTATIKITAI